MVNDTVSIDTGKKLLSGKGSIDSILKLLESIKGYDETLEKQKFMKFFGIFFVTMMITIFGSFVVAAIFDTGYGFIVPGLCIAMLVFLFIRKSVRYRRALITDYSSYVEPILRRLAEDIDPQFPVTIRLDLERPTAKQYCIETKPPCKRGDYYKSVDAFYRREPLMLVCRLVDGNVIHVVCRELVRERTMTKKNARGKIKTKVRLQKKFASRVRVIANPKRYTFGEGKDIETRAERKRPLLIARIKEESAETTGVPDYHAALNGMQRIYRMLTPVNKAA